jgi:hypothetical protein
MCSPNEIQTEYLSMQQITKHGLTIPCNQNKERAREPPWKILIAHVLKDASGVFFSLTSDFSYPNV